MTLRHRFFFFEVFIIHQRHKLILANFGAHLLKFKHVSNRPVYFMTYAHAVGLLTPWTYTLTTW